MTSEMVTIPSFCTQCRSRCGCTAYVEDGRLQKIEPLPSHPSGAKLCPKGRAATELVYHPDRLTQPLRRTTPKSAKAAWEPISWTEALDEIARRMAEYRDTTGPETVAFSVTTPSGTHISDCISWIERFIRSYGSPNTIYGTEICNWHKDVAARFTYGTDIGIPDFAHTDCAVLWGNNPAATWLARLGEVQKGLKKGAKLIVIDPKPTVLARRADCWLRVKPGMDQALALGIAKALMDQRGYDEAFLREWTNGPFLIRSDTGKFLRQSDIVQGGDPAVLLASAASSGGLLGYHSETGAWLDTQAELDLFAALSVETLEGAVSCRTAMSVYADTAGAQGLEWIAEITGVSVADIEHAAALLAEAEVTAYYTWNGVGQSATATQTDRAISLLYTLTGSYGHKGGNVSGAAASFADISGHELLSDEQRAKALGLSDRPLGPGNTGWVTARDVYKAVLEDAPYPVRMLFSFGGNLLAAQPDPERAVEAFKKLDFHVHTDFFLNATSEYADIVLPVATSWEREGLRNGFDVSLEGMRRVQLHPAVIEPVGEAKSDTDIVLALAERLGMASQFFDGDIDKGHEAIVAPSGLTITDLRENLDGVTVDGRVPYRAYAATDEGGNLKGFPTPTRRIEIYSETLLQHGYDPVPCLHPDYVPTPDTDFPLTLGCAKTLSFCHSQHRNIPSLRRLTPDPILELSKELAARHEVEDGDWLRVTTRSGSFVARAKLLSAVRPDTVFAQHGWWIEGEAGSPYDADNLMAANLNRAISTAVGDPVSGSIPLRRSNCRIEKLATEIT